MVITKSGDVTKQGSVKCSEENSVLRRVSLLVIISYLSLCGREWGEGGRYNFAAFRMGAYSNKYGIQLERRALLALCY